MSPHDSAYVTTVVGGPAEEQRTGQYQTARGRPRNARQRRAAIQLPASANQPPRRQVVGRYSALNMGMVRQNGSKLEVTSHQGACCALTGSIILVWRDYTVVRARRALICSVMVSLTLSTGPTCGGDMPNEVSLTRVDACPVTVLLPSVAVTVQVVERVTP